MAVKPLWNHPLCHTFHCPLTGGFSPKESKKSCHCSFFCVQLIRLFHPFTPHPGIVPPSCRSSDMTIVFSLCQAAKAAACLRHSSWASLQRGSLGMAAWLTRTGSLLRDKVLCQKMSFQNHQNVFGLADMLCLKTCSWVIMLFDFTWFSIT